MIKTIIFDFDGVICNSIEAKTNAFKKLYEPYGEEIQEKVVSHHLLNGGVSRFKKFKHYHNNFLNNDIQQEEIDMLSSKFSKLVISEVVNSSFVPGVLDYLSQMSKNTKMFISTGTPTAEIKKIIKLKDLDQYFTNVYGSPDEKIIHIKTILKDYKINASETIFYGDSNSDSEAAEAFNIPFILIKNEYNKFLQKKYNSSSINDFLDLL